MSTWPELVISVARLRHRDNLADLKRQPSNDAVIDIDTVVQSEGLGITTSRIPDGADVHVCASLASSLTGIEARGTVRSSWEGECRRCLEPVTGPLDFSIDATFLDEERVATHDSSIDEADVYSFTGDSVDLGEVVREELLLALPLSPLCRDECEGADPTHFSAAQSHTPDGSEDDEPEFDPRWAALSELTFDEE